MSDAHLNALAHTCTYSRHPRHPLDITLPIDFLSILWIIYSNTTKLSTALNPSTPTYSTAIRPPKDLIAHASTLTSNASFTKRLTALENLARAHLSLIARVPSKVDATSGTEEYLSKTAVVHELIAQAKAADPQSLSRSNLVAVRKHWLEHSETVSDAEAMLELEAFASDDDDDKGTEFDDGWDDPDLYLGSDKSEQGPKQKQHAKTILPVVQHASALLKDVNIALLGPAAVDNLADEIFNSPDNLSDLDQSRDEFVRALATVATTVKAFWKGKKDPSPANEKIHTINRMQPSSLFSGRSHPQMPDGLLMSPYIVRVQLCATKGQKGLIVFIVPGFSFVKESMGSFVV
ncbi:hypothetical protein V8E53_004763 [Lactarius tabidus]